MNHILSVSELTSSIKNTLEENFGDINLIGEISNFKAHVSGHWYFTLKDSSAQISATMWKGVNSLVFFTPQDGMKVIVRGKITVYPPRGNYQLDVRSMKPAGEGELQAAFEKLKRKLSDEGLFDVKHKKTISKFSNKIGIVTGIGTAALKDMISVAERRFPLAELVIAPARVQGEGSAEQIVASLKMLNNQNDIDLIIIARGGGSLEDLWPFNEEIVARAVFDSRIPVISGVGHEVDFTITDFVADLRAPTPTAAMELATPDKRDIFAFINEFFYYSSNNLTDKINKEKKEIAQILNSYGFKSPQDNVRNKSQFLDNLVFRIQNSVDKKITYDKNRLNLIKGALQSNNIDKILKKGFVLVKQKGNFVTRESNFIKDESFILKFFDNEIIIK
ncbi:MAG: exodeoxyribonuclease VII large subunit [Bacteroidetes bacterium]|nr:exodeoxyribonuclease VII large subunit [Bacteroidota bacterium]